MSNVKESAGQTGKTAASRCSEGANTSTGSAAARLDLAIPSLAPGEAQLMLGLFERALPNLCARDLQELSEQRDNAEAITRRMAALCEGLAWLISADGSTGSIRVGSFQHADDVADLLLLLGANAEHANALLQLSGAADNVAEDRASTPASGGLQ